MFSLDRIAVPPPVTVSIEDGVGPTSKSENVSVVGAGTVMTQDDGLDPVKSGRMVIVRVVFSSRGAKGLASRSV
jgi:hypothetical protein